MEIGKPIWKSRELTYVFPIISVKDTFTFQETSYIEASAFPDVDAATSVETLHSLLKPFLEVFLEKTKSNFASPLTIKTILSRLSFIWLHSAGPKVEADGWYTVTWTPKELSIKPKDFVLTFVPSSIEPTEPKIPSDFLAAPTPRSQSPAPELRTIHIQPPSTNNLVEFELPLADSEDPRFPHQTYESSAHDLERKKLREAKLRAALASLKVERLTEKYYKKYGTLPGEESSDEYSSDEEESQ
jgi:hypothetical protein